MKKLSTKLLGLLIMILPTLTTFAQSSIEAERKLSNVMQQMLNWIRPAMGILIFLMLIAAGFNYKQNDGEISKGYIVAIVVLIIGYLVAKPLAEAIMGTV